MKPEANAGPVCVGEEVASGVPVVYVHMDADRKPLYIGYSARYPRRVREHARSARWWAEVAFTGAVAYSCKAEALHVERLLIRRWTPPYNRAAA